MDSLQVTPISQANVWAPVFVSIGNLRTLELLLTMAKLEHQKTTLLFLSYRSSISMVTIHQLALVARLVSTTIGIAKLATKS